MKEYLCENTQINSPFTEFAQGGGKKKLPNSEKPTAKMTAEELCDSDTECMDYLKLLDNNHGKTRETVRKMQNPTGIEANGGNSEKPVSEMTAEELCESDSDCVDYLKVLAS